MAVFGIMLAALLGALVLVWSRNERMRELQRQASQDPLTGLKNRRRFEEDLRAELARSRRNGTTGALLTLDLDNFKQVNDTLGHPVGDRVIEEIAGVLGGRTRETDVLARIGGDEFAIVLPDCDAEEAQQVGETIATADARARAAAAGSPPDHGQRRHSDVRQRHGGGHRALLAQADSAMYAAKAGGRDAVRLAGWLGGPREKTDGTQRPPLDSSPARAWRRRRTRSAEASNSERSSLPVRSPRTGRPRRGRRTGSR